MKSHHSNKSISGTGPCTWRIDVAHSQHIDRRSAASRRGAGDGLGLEDVAAGFRVLLFQQMQILPDSL